MIPIIAAIVLIIVAVGFYVYRNQGPNRKQQLLADLGLSQKWSKEKTTPFYRWEWKKGTQDRIWAERIVRNAFHQVRAWLSPEDLAFFQSHCEAHASNQKVSHEEIEKRVDQILYRTSLIFTTAQIYLTDLLSEILGADPQQVREYVRKKTGKSDVRNPNVIFTRQRLREWMRMRALEIIGQNSEGMNIIDAERNHQGNLRGPDGLRFWAIACQQSIVKAIPNKVPTPFSTAARELRGITTQVLFKDFIEDVDRINTLRDTLEDEVARQKLQISPDTPHRLGIFFCQWMYNPDIALSREDAKNIIEFLCRSDLSPVFRNALIQGINSNYGSLNSAVSRFPAYVIFYGENDTIRSMAVRRYYRHLLELRRVFTVCTEHPKNPPGVIHIVATDIETQRERFQEQKKLAEDPNYIGYKDPEETLEYLPFLIDTQKQYNRFERSINELTAEMLGWIIDIELGDFSMEEYAHLDRSKYKNYPRISCDLATDGQGQDSGNTSQMNDQWNRILEKLTQNTKTFQL